MSKFLYEMQNLEWIFKLSIPVYTTVCILKYHENIPV